MDRLFGTLLLCLIPVYSWAGVPVVVSSAPNQIGVTVYQDQNRNSDEIYESKPNSFAFIYETRTVVLPRGVVTVRFEGIASGIIPQSAILIGAEERERNRDAAILSRGGLVDAFTGQDVLLRRTNPATGQRVEERATIRSGTNGLIIQTPHGAEALYCGGLTQTLIYPDAPTQLSAKPVLSMTTKEQPGGTVTITLAYLATGFDWTATYTGILGADNRSIALSAWLTIASGDDTSFSQASVSAVAGDVSLSDKTYDTQETERSDIDVSAPTSQCWPNGNTSRVYDHLHSQPRPAESTFEYSEDGELIEVFLVGGSARRETFLRDFTDLRRLGMTAALEDLGDVKLFRIPALVTVAARSQKQVAFMNQTSVKGQLVYRTRISDGEPADVVRIFRFQNDRRSGLGGPLPAGDIILYQNGRRGRQLIGQSRIANKATEEEVEIELGDDSSVSIQTRRETIEDYEKFSVTVANNNIFPVRFEIEFSASTATRFQALSARTIRKSGKQVWSVMLPANTRKQLTYEVHPIDLSNRN